MARKIEYPDYEGQELSNTTPVVVMTFCETLERELNAANKRIAELEKDLHEAYNDERMNTP